MLSPIALKGNAPVGWSNLVDEAELSEAWQQVIPFASKDVRRIIDTTDEIDKRFAQKYGTFLMRG